MLYYIITYHQETDSWSAEPRQAAAAYPGLPVRPKPETDPQPEDLPTFDGIFGRRASEAAWALRRRLGRRVSVRWKLAHPVTGKFSYLGVG